MEMNSYDKNISVIGAGTMGHGIAEVFALQDTMSTCMKTNARNKRECKEGNRR